MEATHIITRIWHGTTGIADADRYLQYLLETGFTDYRKTPGNISAKVLRRYEGDVCHFLAVTEWEDLDSIIGFAGQDYLKARYYPRDAEFLLELEAQVQHYQSYEAGFSDSFS